MRNYFALACAVLVVGQLTFRELASTTRQAAKSKAQTDLTNLLDTRIKAEWEAIKIKDEKAYGELLADDYIAVEADGGGERFKWKALSELKQSVVSDYSLSFLKVTELCPGTAFARYEAFIKFPSKSTVRFEKILVGEVWVSRGDQWKALHYQETRVK